VCAAPGGAGNSGGSFLAITKYADDPQTSFERIKWLQTPQNQTKTYTDIDLFPCTPASYDDPAVRKRDEFFGGQRIIDVFGPSAEAVKPVYLSPYDSDLVNPVWSEELLNMQNAGKDPDRAWDDAISKIERQLEHAGGLKR
jgi:cellobiose transport system substrate-binding protein